MKKILVCLLLLASCQTYVRHPGAIDDFDSVTYDTLKIVQGTIDTARDQFKAGLLPDTMKPVLNRLVDAYNVAMPSYKLWHELASTGKPAADRLSELNRDMADMATALTAFRGGK